MPTGKPTRTQRAIAAAEPADLLASILQNPHRELRVKTITARYRRLLALEYHCRHGDSEEWHETSRSIWLALEDIPIVLDAIAKGAELIKEHPRTRAGQQRSKND